MGIQVEEEDMEKREESVEIETEKKESKKKICGRKKRTKGKKGKRNVDDNREERNKTEQTETESPIERGRETETERGRKTETETVSPIERGRETETETVSPIERGRETETETVSPIERGRETKNNEIENNYESPQSRRADTEEIFSQQNSGEWTNLAETKDFTKIKLKFFANDCFLAAKFKEFLEQNCENGTNNANDENVIKNEAVYGNVLQLVDVGIYVNEICHRLALIDWIETDEKEKKELRMNWRRLKETELTTESNAKGNLGDLWDKLHNLLRQIVLTMDGDKSAILSEIGANERRTMREHLYLHKLAFFHAKGAIQFAGPIESALLAIFKFDIDNSVEIGQMSKRFKHILDNYIKVIEQGKIDESLFMQYKNDHNFGEEKMDKMAEHLQEINFSSDQMKLKVKKSILVKNALIAKGFNEIEPTEFNRTLQKVISAMRELISNWSADVQFVLSDLHLLHHSVDRVNSICIFPNTFGIENILGNHFYNLTSIESRQKCQDESLYCALCRNSEFKSVLKSWRDRITSVPMLKCTFMGVQMDMPLIIVPGIAKMPPRTPTQMDTILRILTINVEKVTRADHIFDEGVYWNEQKWFEAEEKRLNEELLNEAAAEQSTQIAQRIDILNKNKQMLTRERQIALSRREKVKDWTGAIRIVAEFGNYAKMLTFINTGEGFEKIDEESALGKFRIVLIYLEQWAKNNYIYSAAKLGMLERNVLLLMLTKIFVLYPNSSIPFLIDKFFFTYSTWKWPMPVQLAPIDSSRKAEFLNWSPGREWFSKRQFAPENIRKSIRKEMAMAIITPTFPEQNTASNINLSTAKLIRHEIIKAREQIRMTSDINWPIWGQNFTEKYDHYIVFICIGPPSLIDQFCSFVGERLRHELLELVEIPLAEYVHYCHVFPQAIVTEKCTEEAEATERRTNNEQSCQKIWAVGIELKEAISSRLKGKLRTKLKRMNICSRILNQFDYPKSMDLQLEYADGKEKLRQWHEPNF